MLKFIFCYMGVINLFAFVIYGVDKRRAIRHAWRIPEAALIAFAAVGGAIGAALGMKVFHHKTRKLKFKIVVPLFCVLWLALLVALCYNFNNYR